MAYYFASTVHIGFEEPVSAAVAELAKHGFGVLSDIDVQATLHKKLVASADSGTEENFERSQGGNPAW